VLSWRFVEMPFRRRSNDSRQWLVFVSAFVVTGSLFVASALIWQLHGFPQRFPDDVLRYAEQNEFPSQFETARSEQIEADDLPMVGRANGGEPAFLIWGDSHAPPVAAAMEQVAAKCGVWGYVAANPDITPVLGTWRPQAGKQGVRRNQAVFNFLRKKKIKTVILASDWFVNTHPRENGSLDSLIVDDENELISPSNAIGVLRRGLRRTVAELQRAGADVWIMRQVPMQRDLPSRLAFDAWLKGQQPPEVGVTSKEHADVQAPLNSLLSEFERGNVHLLDPAEVCFSPSHLSFIAENGRSYYWDRTHLSVVGAQQMLSRLFEPVIQQIANGVASGERDHPHESGGS
jgi:hypothetical protein